MKVLVVDTSVVLAFYLPAERYKVQASALMRDHAANTVKLVTSTLSHYEVLNVLSRAVRGTRRGPVIDRDEALRIVMSFRLLELEQHSVEGLERRILEIAARYQRSGYDASYLALAEHLGADLITGDERLYNAVRGDLPTVQFVASYVSADSSAKG